MELNRTILAVAACAVMVAGAARGAEDATTTDLQATLLSWAVVLSGHPPPKHPPRLQRKGHEFFVLNACAGSECQVWGWFPPGDTVYIDERLDPQTNLLAASIVVHEMVHFLQYQTAHGTTEFSCANSLALEREAYAVQREFILHYGVYQPVGVSMHNVGCSSAP